MTRRSPDPWCAHPQPEAQDLEKRSAFAPAQRTATAPTRCEQRRSALLLAASSPFRRDPHSANVEQHLPPQDRVGIADEAGTVLRPPAPGLAQGSRQDATALPPGSGASRDAARAPALHPLYTEPTTGCRH